MVAGEERITRYAMGMGDCLKEFTIQSFQYALKMLRDSPHSDSVRVLYCTLRSSHFFFSSSCRHSNSQSFSTRQHDLGIMRDNDHEIMINRFNMPLSIGVGDLCKFVERESRTIEGCSWGQFIQETMY